MRVIAWIVFPSPLYLRQSPSLPLGTTTHISSASIHPCPSVLIPITHYSKTSAEEVERGRDGIPRT